MGLRFRISSVRCLAILVGVTFGLLSSSWDFSEQTSPNVQPAKGHRPHARVSATSERSVDKNDGIILEESPESVVIVPKPKPKPTTFAVNKSSLGKVVNPHPFYYTMEPKNACQGKDLFLVAYVHTSPDHYDRRKLIRKTWGNSSLYTKDTFRVFFMMGKPGTIELQKALDLESEQYNDIVQENFVDAYHNLSIKAVSAMKWTTTRCKQAKFILKTDDDVFVNAFPLLKHLKDLDRDKVNNTGLLMCLVWYKMHVLREGKWKVNESIIAEDVYPHYCSGMAYIMSPDVAEAIYKASEYVPFFWVDDVYITGMVPKRIGLRHVNIGKLFMGRKEVEYILGGPDWHKYLFSHLRDMPYYQLMFDKLVKRAQNEKIPDMKETMVGRIATNYGPKKPPGTEKSKGKNKQQKKDSVKKTDKKKDKKSVQLL